MSKDKVFYPTFDNPHLTLFVVHAILDALYEAENEGLTKTANVVGALQKYRRELEKDCFKAMKKRA